MGGGEVENPAHEGRCPVVVAHSPAARQTLLLLDSIFSTIRGWTVAGRVLTVSPGCIACWKATDVDQKYFCRRSVPSEKSIF